MKNKMLNLFQSGARHFQDVDALEVFRQHDPGSMTQGLPQVAQPRGWQPCPWLGGWSSVIFKTPST